MIMIFVNLILVIPTEGWMKVFCYDFVTVSVVVNNLQLIHGEHFAVCYLNVTRCTILVEQLQYYWQWRHALKGWGQEVVIFQQAAASFRQRRYKCSTFLFCP